MITIKNPKMCIRDSSLERSIKIRLSDRSIDMARMKDFYKETVAPALFKKFGYKSVMQIPKLDKIVVNVACGEAKENHKIIENVMSELAQITGQKPVECRSKKAVANFKLREGQVCLLYTSSPSRIFKGKGMAGHMGAENVTVQNLVCLLYTSTC